VTLRGPELPQVSPGQSMSREELERAYVSSNEDMNAVAAALKGYGLEELGRAPSARLTPSDLEERYRFSAGEAEGQTVAIAEFGGAYFPDDLTAFCREQGRPEATVRQVGGWASPSSPSSR
jgi:hypothetical protein